MALFSRFIKDILVHCYYFCEQDVDLTRGTLKRLNCGYKYICDDEALADLAKQYTAKYTLLFLFASSKITYQNLMYLETNVSFILESFSQQIFLNEK